MPEQPGETLYSVLGVLATASPEEIKAAHRRVSRKVHPDFGGSDGMFRLVQHAYAVLSDPEKRAAYDRDGDRRHSAGDPVPDDGGLADEWGEESSWVADPPNPGFHFAGPTPDSDPHPDPDASDDLPDLDDMEPPPTAAAPSPVAPIFVPPLTQPPQTPRRTPRWPRWWKIGSTILAVPFLAFVTFGVVVDQTYSPTGQDRSFDPIAVITESVLPYVVVILFVFVFGPPWVAKRSRAEDRLTGPLATDLLPWDFLGRRVHGTPGSNLSAGRFGLRNSILGREGETRTGKIIEDSVLPTYPAMHLLHGLHRPGTDHADIDHVLVFGKTVIAIDSKLWRPGHYWWDGRDLYREGRRQHAVAFGDAVTALRRALPGRVRVIGLVAVHGWNGRLGEPWIENAAESRDPIGGQMVPLLNPNDLVTMIRHLADATPDAHVVDVRLLRVLVEQSAAWVDARKQPAGFAA